MLATVGTVIGTAYLLLMLKNVVFGPLREPASPAPVASPHSASLPLETAGLPASVNPVRKLISPINWHEMAGIGPLMVLMVAFGVFPRPNLRPDPTGRCHDYRRRSNATRPRRQGIEPVGCSAGNPEVTRRQGPPHHPLDQSKLARGSPS